MSERTEHGFRTGAIEAIALGEAYGYGSVMLRVGDAEIEVTASPKGRKGYVILRNGKRTSLDYQGHVLWTSEP